METEREEEKNSEHHEEQDQEQPSAPSHTGTTRQPLKELETPLSLLKSPDDTSRFVGLAILKPVLERELIQEKREDEEKQAIILRCWKAIQPKFLDGLLRANSSVKTSKEDAKNMVTLAVAIMHVFMRFMDSYQTDAKALGRVPSLMFALRSSDPETTEQIMEVLHSLIMTPEGSLAAFQNDVKVADDDQKPLPYLLITMLLIDIRASIPSLQEKLHSQDYPVISARLARAYDIVSAFVVYLVQSLDKMLDDESFQREPAAPMPVDLLLKLRTNISETVSLTLEYLRDRYDSSTAGAAGLHPDARFTNGESASNPLPIAWDTSSGMFSDSLILAQLSCSSLWLRDEENDTLRQEAAGITDVLLALYERGEDSKALGENEQNARGGNKIFRSTVLVALEGVIETPAGVEAFLHEDGWNILAKDLVENAENVQEHPQGIEIIRVLLAVLESCSVRPAKEEWMFLVGLASKTLSSTAEEANLEFAIAVSQLAVELLVKAPHGVRKKNRERALELLKRAEALSMKDYDDGGIEDGLEEVVEGLESLELGNLGV